MGVIEQVIKNKRYKERIDQLSNENLIVIAKDHLRALEEAQKGIGQEEPDRINDVKYVQDIANSMQQLAQKVLEERAKK